GWSSARPQRAIRSPESVRRLLLRCAPGERGRQSTARCLLAQAGPFFGAQRARGDRAMATLSGMKIAILAAEGFEQAELTEPRKALEEAGAETRVVSPAKGEVQGWKHFDKGERIKVDVPLEQADAADYDALLLPGGVANPDQLRALPKAVQFVRAFFETGKPVAAICH